MDGKTLGKLASDAGYLDMDIAAVEELFCDANCRNEREKREAARIRRGDV